MLLNYNPYFCYMEQIKTKVAKSINTPETTALTPWQTMRMRHKEAVKKLNELFVQKKASTGMGETALYAKIAGQLNTTGQTVRNYNESKGGDGFMLEAIIAEFEKL